MMDFFGSARLARCALLTGVVVLARPAMGASQCHNGEASTSKAGSFEMYYRGQLGCTDAVWWGVMAGIQGNQTESLWKWDHHRDDLERELRPQQDPRYTSTQVLLRPQSLAGLNLAANTTGGIGGWEYSVSPVYPDGRPLGTQTERFPTAGACEAHRATIIQTALSNLERTRQNQTLSAGDERSFRSFAAATPCVPRGSGGVGEPTRGIAPMKDPIPLPGPDLGNIPEGELQALARAAQLIALAGGSEEAAAALAQLSRMSSDELLALGLSQGIAALLGESPDLTSALSAMARMPVQDVEGLNLLGEVAGGLGNAAGLGEELRRWTSASAAELKGQAVGAGIASLVGSVGQDALAFGQIGGLLGSLLTKSPEEKAAEAERQRQLEAQQREFTRRVAAQFNAQGAGSPVAQRREWRGGDPDAAGRDTTEIKVRIPRQESRWRSGGVPLTTETPSVAPPYSTAPDLSDWTDLDRAVALGYPAELRDSGVGGSVNVWVFVERGGGVLDMRLDHTSGHADLDLAAMRILKTLSFEPARREGEPVGAWISVPVTFRATNPRVPIGGWTN